MKRNRALKKRIRKRSVCMLCISLFVASIPVYGTEELLNEESDIILQTEENEHNFWTEEQSEILIEIDELPEEAGGQNTDTESEETESEELQSEKGEPDNDISQEELQISLIEEVEEPEQYSSGVNHTTGLGVAKHTEAEIVSYLKNSGVTLYDKVIFEQTPVCVPPYSAGKLSEQTKASALAMLNNVRYIAGLSHNVTWNVSYEEMAQAGAVVTAANGYLSHRPVCPNQMESNLYDLGYLGCSQGNLGIGYASLNDAIINGWMSDEDSKNIDRVGHRRWILNPDMGKTAFGATPRGKGVRPAYVMYAFDHSNSSATERKVAWPAQVTPIEYFLPGSPWSVSIGSTVDKNAIEVLVSRKRDGRVWQFSAQKADGYFNVNNGNYGQLGCIIFRPDSINYSDGDVFDVTISGLEETIQYSVSFFSLDKYWHVHNQNDIRWSWSSDLKTCEVHSYCRCGYEQVKIYPCTVIKKEEPTCTKDGYIEVEVVTDEIGVITADEELEALEHKYSKNWSDNGDGVYSKICAVCGKAKSRLLQVNVSSVTLQKNQSTSCLKVKMTKGDEIVSTKSSRSDIVKVSVQNASSGKIKLSAKNKTGTAQITIRLASGVSRTISVKVQKGKVKTKKIVLSDDKITLAKNKTYKLKTEVTPLTTSDKISYATSNSKVATVSSKGIITAKAGGKAKITVKSGSKKAVITVTVPKTVPTGLTGIPARKTLKKGKTLILKPKLAPKGAEAKITYKSSKKSVAIVDAKGKVTAKKKGTAVITVTAGKIKKTCVITVK